MVDDTRSNDRGSGAANRLGGSRSRPPMASSDSCCPFVLVDQATQNGPTRDAFVAEVREGVSRLRWAKATGTVGPLTVVVPNIFCDHYTQVPLTEDQHTVGEFSSDSAHESFGEAVRPRTTRRNPDHLDAHIGQDSIE